jgi:hypothetical protein
MLQTPADEHWSRQSTHLTLAPEAVLILASYLTRKVSEGPGGFVDQAERRVVGDLQKALAEDSLRDPERAAKLAAARERLGRATSPEPGARRSARG